jgi:hypothetical protein
MVLTKGALANGVQMTMFSMSGMVGGCGWGVTMLAQWAVISSNNLCTSCADTQRLAGKNLLVGGDGCGSHELMSKTWRNAQGSSMVDPTLIRCFSSSSANLFLSGAPAPITVIKLEQG